MRNSKVRGAAALAAALLVSTGCATKRDLRDLSAEMRAMTARQDTILTALARQSEVTQDTLRRQTDQLFEIRGNVSRQLDLVLDALATLRELTGQNQRTIAAVRDQLEGLRSGTAAGATGPEGPGGSEAVGGDVEASGAAEATYNAAMQQYQRGSLATAERAFADFLGTYGNHALAPDARFFLGDIQAQRDRPREAIATWGQIAELHPSSARVPDALFRIGILELELGNRDEARRFLERVVNTYPESLSAGPARERLRELR